MRLFEGTEWDRPPHCEKCDKPEAEFECPEEQLQTPPPEKQTAKLALEKRRKGKMVTVIRDLIDEGPHLSELLTKLKSSCGAGGTLKAGVIEIQGKQLERVREELVRLGYQTRG